MANSTRPSRRAFLKASAAGAVALAGLSIARSAHAAGKQEIKIGMIGCGGRCSGAAQRVAAGRPRRETGRHVRHLPRSPAVQVRLVQEEHARARSSPIQDHLFAGFDGYKKVIDSVNVVLIACASKFHPMYAEAAIRAGKHVFVEKPHGIDPVGVRRMQAAAELAKQKNLSLLSGLQSRFHNGYREAVQRIHDGAIGKVVAMQVMFLRGPYQIVNRNPAYSETQYQFSNWYHFCWLSGDDVTQSLVHNMDRAAWILKEEMPSWCFGLGGRSASFGDAYGDMYDHHTVVYEYASGTRVYALCRTQYGCYGNSGDIIMGTQGPVRSGRLPHQRRDELAVSRAPHNNPYLDEQRALIESVRNGKPINSGSVYGRQHDVDRAGPIGLLHRPAAEVGRRGQFRVPVRPRPGRCQFRHAAAVQAGRHRQLPDA